MPPLTRSSSEWLIPPHTDGEEEQIRDQRRIRHLSAVLIRNLTLNPRRDELSSLLHAPAPPSGPTPARAQDDTDLLLRSVQKRQSRAGSSASMGSFKSGGSRVVPEEWRGRADGRDDESGSGSQTPVAGSSGEASSMKGRTRPRRASAASTLIREETEPISPISAPTALAEPSPPSPDHIIDLDTPTSPSMRKRSASRASATSALSAGTSASNSTIRQSNPRPDGEGTGSFSPHPPTTPKLPPPSTAGPRTFHAAGSEAQVAKEKARRAEILRRRLVDSFITLELSPTPSPAEGDQLRSGRRRAPTVGGATLRGRMVRSDSASSSLSLGGGDGSLGGWRSPKKRPSRTRTYSSPVAPSLASTSTLAPPPTPFFVSSPAHETMHPNFVVDREGFSICTSDDSGPLDLDQEAALAHWEGLRESRLVVKVWTRGGELGGKGKEREEWKLLVEWDVELAGLVSLGRDPTAFPPLPPNTLIFHLASDDEYYTAPLPSRRRRRSHSHKLGFHSGLGSLSDGDAEEDENSEGSCCSSEESEDEGGNQSDPGAAGTVSFRSRRAAGLAGGVRRRRAESAVARGRSMTFAEREAEEARRRKALVEKSVRETRMVRAAKGLEVSRLVALEHDLDQTRQSIVGLKRTLTAALGGEGDEQSLECLERERNETKDRVDDLECVKGDMKDDLDKARQALDRRKEALQSRRGRLRAAEELGRTRRSELESLGQDIADDESTCIDLRRASQTRRTQVITLLSHIFPIDPYAPKKASAASLSAPPLLFSILSLPLPNSTYSPALLASETVSSALGYTAQVVATLAAYLGVPLHYPIKCLGSRSAVVDLISMMRGPRAFPLYPKGVDLYRFDYAVFLLNKNIEQLMYSQGLTVIDLRNTLPNLKSLILALSYDPSHGDFAASTLALPPPQFNVSSSTSELGQSRPNDVADPSTRPKPSSAGPQTERDEAEPADDDDIPRSPTSTLRPASVRSSSPTPTVASVRSNGTANGSAVHGSTDSAPSPPSKDGLAKPRSAEKVKVKLSTSAAPPTKPKLNGRETLVAEEAKAGLLRGAIGKAEGSTARKSSGSRIASSLWSAVGYGES